MPPQTYEIKACIGKETHEIKLHISDDELSKLISRIRDLMTPCSFVEVIGSDYRAKLKNIRRNHETQATG
jgi:hypothetical protein